MENESYSVFAKTDIAGRVVGVNSSAFLPSPDGWVEVDNGTGERFYHAQGNYLRRPLLNDDGIYQYKLVGGTIVERTEEEMASDQMPESTPSVSGTTESRIAALERFIAAQDQQIAMLLEGVTEDE